MIDLRSVWPLDSQLICDAVRESGRLLVIDEDFERFGLSGDVAAVVLEAGIGLKFGRVCTHETIPYAGYLEDAALGSGERIVKAVQKLVEG